MLTLAAVLRLASCTEPSSQPQDVVSLVALTLRFLKWRAYFGRAILLDLCAENTFRLEKLSRQG